MNQLRGEVLELLEGKVEQEQAEALTDKLTQGTWPHDHPISLKGAKALGLNVHADMPAEFYPLMSVFPQPTRQQPSVQYIPAPCTPPAPGGQHRGAG